MVIIDNHDGYYRQEYYITTEMNLFVTCFKLQDTASIIGFKAQLAPPLQKMSA